MQTSFRLFEIEGVDGSGKTTAIELIQHAAQYAFKQDPQSQLAKISTIGLPHGMYRDLLLKEKRPHDSMVDAMLFTGDRFDALQKHQGFQGYLICDRYLFSTLVYQGDQAGIDESATLTQTTISKNDFIKFLHLKAGMPYPERSVLLTASIKELARRLSERKKKDVYDQIDELEKRSDRYTKLASSGFLPYNITIIDNTNMSRIETVSAVIRTLFEKDKKIIEEFNELLKSVKSELFPD